jgi:hypothetical protein
MSSSSLREVQGPVVWRDNPINLRSIAAALSSLTPSEPVTSQPRLGVDYIPPLNARADIKVAVRSPEDTRQLLSNVGLQQFTQLPEAFSWNNLETLVAIKGFKASVPPILPAQSQYACGSCWAWASATMLSDRFAIFTGQPNLNLSPTFLLSCMGPESACGGGFPSDAGKFLETRGTPQMKCWDYSWCSDNNTCLHSDSNSTTAALNQLLPKCSEQCLQRGALDLYKAQANTTQALTDRYSIQVDILHNGPVVAVYRVFGDFVAGSMSKTVYPQSDGWNKTRGIYVHVTGQDIYGYGTIDCLGARQDAPECYMGNHAVVIVGWGMERNVPNFLDPKGRPLEVPYWIVRNSWGPQWQDNGFFRIAMSDPDTGVNMAVALDRPISIGGRDFGAVTTWLPDVTRTVSAGIRNQPSSLQNQAILAKYSVRWNIVLFGVALCVVLGIIALLVLKKRQRLISQYGGQGSRGR